ncbi:MAG TPA: hypothetical protein VEM15_01985 [Thermodesulfobacteriota bacterium]|nr:hypothetical protein [Thermodesulfobacteriota bacterium]
MSKAKVTRQRLTKKECRDWYASLRPTYESLTHTVCAMLEGLLKEKHIDYLSVYGRAKNIDSFTGKIRRKHYGDPTTDIHDLSGVRVIAFIESDVQKIAELIKSAFTVHFDKSLDKTDELGTDRTGYRSIHLVCDLGKQRVSLPEYAPFKGLLFEVQVRTVLQHAWAEVEHDRNYKFAGVLPPHLQRRLNLAAGTLEMVDREFDSLANAIDEYEAAIAKETRKGNLDIPINTKSLREFLLSKGFDSSSMEMGFVGREVIREITAFGIRTLEDLNMLLTGEFCSAHSKFVGRETDAGYVRSAMMFADMPRYFKVAWKKHWVGIDRGTVALIASKYGRGKFQKALKTHNIDIFSDEVTN